MIQITQGKLCSLVSRTIKPPSMSTEAMRRACFPNKCTGRPSSFPTKRCKCPTQEVWCNQGQVRQILYKSWELSLFCFVVAARSVSNQGGWEATSYTQVRSLNNIPCENKLHDSTALLSNCLDSLANQIVSKILNNDVALPRLHRFCIDADQKCSIRLLDRTAPSSLHRRAYRFTCCRANRSTKRVWHLNKVILVADFEPSGNALTFSRVWME